MHVFHHRRQNAPNAEMKNVNSLHFKSSSLSPQSNGSLCICMRQVTPDFFTALGKVFLYPVTQLISNIDSQFVPRTTFDSSVTSVCQVLPDKANLDLL